MLHLYCTLENETGGLATRSSIAVITPYAQQAALLRRTFANRFGENYTKKVEINTVDAFQVSSHCQRSDCLYNFETNFFFSGKRKSHRHIFMCQGCRKQRNWFPQ